MKTVKAFQRKGGKVKGPTKRRGDSAYYRALGMRGVEARRAKRATRGAQIDPNNPPEGDGIY